MEKKSLIELMDEVKQTSKTKLLETWFKELFEECPEAHFFFWSQYTDNFNDGEQCEFHLQGGIAAATKSKKDITTEKEIENAFRFYYEVAEGGEYKKDTVEYFFADHVDGKAYDLFRLVFGDHVKIAVFRDKVVIMDYNDHN